MIKHLRRSFTVESFKRSEEEGKKNNYIFSFSSEVPVERWFGKEILSHDGSAVDLERFNNSGSVLFNHDWDRFLGRIIRAWIGEDKRGYVEIEFASNPEAQEKRADVDGGFLRNVSFAYVVEDMILHRKNEDGPNEYLVTRWWPYEVSFVTVPADYTVGVGRDSGNEVDPEYRKKIEKLVERELEAVKKANNDAQKNLVIEENAIIKNGGSSMNEQELQAERTRAHSIYEMGQKYGMEEQARSFVKDGKSVDEFRALALEKMTAAKQAPVSQNQSDLALSEKEKRSYSVLRAIQATLSGDWSKAGFERECSRTISQARGKETAGFFLPMNITSERAYNTGAADAGGALVQTDVLGGSFIEMLRNRILLVKLGAKMLTGLVGNVDVPGQATGENVYWVTEGNDVTESNGTLKTVSLRPKTVGTKSVITRNMMLQTSGDIENLVRNSLIASLAVGIDAAGIKGTGAAGQPKGILNTAGIGSVAIGANGGAINYDHFIDLETAVADANADDASLAYLTNARIVGMAKKLKGEDGHYLAQVIKGADPAMPVEINGYKTGRSNNVPKNLTKGTGTNLGAVIFGNFAHLMIGEWGTLEVLPNQFGTGYDAGNIQLRALQTVDIGIAQAGSFAAVTDALTQ